MNNKKIVVVGGVAGGASAAARARRLDEFADITMFEKGPNVSFSNCSLPYHLSGLIPDADSIVLMTPDQFKNQYNIDAEINSEVINANVSKKEVEVKNTQTGELKCVPYDELILSPGANPIMPGCIKGIDHDNVFSVRNVVDIKKIHTYLEVNKVTDVAIVGGGFIGLEVCENLAQTDKHVSLVEASEHVMGTIDDDFAELIHKELYDHGVNVILNDGLAEITDDHIKLGSGNKIKAQVVIMAIGVKPDVALASKIGCKLGLTGGIAVDQHYQTSIPNIYAVGDAIEVSHMITRKKTRLALAFPAQMEARDAIDHIYGRTIENRGVIGSQAIHVFDINIASTGLTESECQKDGIDYRTATVIPKSRVGIMPDATPLYLKLIFGYPNGEVLGAQALGKSDVDKQIDIVSTMISMHGHISDLTHLEVCYSPWFSTAKNAVDMAALVAENILNGEFKQVQVSEIRKLVEKNAFIIDAREPFEYEEGHITTAVNIPLSQFRQRLDEIPNDCPVYVHCLSGQRSYNMVRALNNRGYKNVINISGSYLELCEYEYFKDQTTDRKPIVTNYRFDLL
ncbi:FAD-dependent oxidoreductase [Companilactobacillus alimentarius]|uniref:Pyridine nucleotide-disulfide oxidoreductase n=1 Tax=Companilactobacillus alimentarius DSM 20249 TaxID=1423720 RepID=A0A2K9HMH5_9LACO|nr:FAD-dependent oxidoreductase [Companilactobacillus alimentarius]AUI71223.1 pyridine nucleotide-disulfide oxidoreductase [Companilactobacillus alimentarius DSM 20249]KRK75358.1 putative NADH oxidase (putative) [Companilactobacillus alimentarius DSM 20249]MDT6951498.1 FAD-dependent oxidoreductase [Companilactobacillus alimentarius]GEO43859.1 NADH oxidase [Companilactobacillus alimentarius]